MFQWIKSQHIATLLKVGVLLSISFQAYAASNSGGNGSGGATAHINTDSKGGNHLNMIATVGKAKVKVDATLDEYIGKPQTEEQWKNLLQTDARCKNSDAVWDQYSSILNKNDNQYTLTQDGLGKLTSANIENIIRICNS